MKKWIFITSVAVFSIILAIGLNIYINSNCSACGGAPPEDCLDNGSVTYAGQLPEPYCGYTVAVSGRNGCTSGAPYVYWEDICCPSEPTGSQLMGVDTPEYLCTNYKALIYLKDGHSYDVWFACGYGYDGPYSRSPTCW